jgi:beta-hydroxylase
MNIYRIGQWWDGCLEPTNISIMFQDPSFQSLDNLIAQHQEQIRLECLAMLRSSEEVNMADFDPQHSALMTNDSWKTVWLRYFGKPVPRDISKELSQIVNHPIVYNASLSILEPHSEIPLHVGQCQALVKYHIPLQIPEGDVGMWYNGKTYRWTDRMLFNDVKEHRVWNHTDERRIILLMDLLRPMPFPWDIINHRIASLAWWDPVVRVRYEKISSSSEKCLQHLL